MNRSFVPALASILPLRFTRRIAHQRWLDRAARHAGHHPGGAVFGTTAVFAVLTMAFIPLIEVNDEWSKYVSPRFEFRQAVEAVKPFSGTEPMEFVIDAGAPGQATDAEFRGIVDDFTHCLRAQDTVVTHAFAISDILKRLNRNLNGEEPDSRPSLLGKSSRPSTCWSVS
ncbi:hypothetical protein [Dinoroseobacter sp. S375]|uniref:hypothetical protein n=1 Tax=Dinoroseobacter sp. S375 TaxID=3415136 RepID=UPI003C7DA115